MWDKKREHRTLTGRPWRRLRDAVLLRDGYRCQGCKRLFMPEELECDHVIPLSLNGSNAMENLQTLCADKPGRKGCHSLKTERDSGCKEIPQIGLNGWPVDDR